MSNKISDQISTTQKEASKGAIRECGASQQCLALKGLIQREGAKRHAAGYIVKIFAPELPKVKQALGQAITDANGNWSVELQFFDHATELMRYLRERGRPQLRIEVYEPEGYCCKRVRLLNNTEWRKPIILEVPAPQVPEEGIKEFYKKGKHTYVAKESIHVRHILVQVQEGATAEERQASRARIDKAAKLVLAGKPFEEVATEYSEDNAASAGGDIGFVERGFMPPEFDQVAFTIEPGQVSDIVETQFGYHILEVLEKTPEGIAPYEKMQGFLGKFLQEQLQKKMVTAQVQSLRDKAQIEIFLK